MEKKVKEIIDNEIQKIGIEDLCRSISITVQEEVQKIDDTSEDLLGKKVKEIIDNEIQKIGFEDLCRSISNIVQEKVQKIDEDHNGIKKLYNDIGERLDILIADQESLGVDLEQNTPIRLPGERGKIIVIEDEVTEHNTSNRHKTDFSKNGPGIDTINEYRKSPGNQTASLVSTTHLSTPSTTTSPLPHSASHITSINSSSVVVAKQTTSKSTLVPPPQPSGVGNTTKKLEAVINKLTASKKAPENTESVSTVGEKNSIVTMGANIVAPIETQTNDKISDSLANSTEQKTEKLNEITNSSKLDKNNIVKNKDHEKKDIQNNNFVAETKSPSDKNNAINTVKSKDHENNDFVAETKSPSDKNNAINTVKSKDHEKKVIQNDDFVAETKSPSDKNNANSIVKSKDREKKDIQNDDLVVETKSLSYKSNTNNIFKSEDHEKKDIQNDSFIPEAKSPSDKNKVNSSASAVEIPKVKETVATSIENKDHDNRVVNYTEEVLQLSPKIQTKNKEYKIRKENLKIRERASGSESTPCDTVQEEQVEHNRIETNINEKRKENIQSDPIENNPETLEANQNKISQPDSGDKPSNIIDSSYPPALSRKFPILGEPPFIIRSPVEIDVRNKSPKEDPPILTILNVSTDTDDSPFENIDNTLALQLTQYKDSILSDSIHASWNQPDSPAASTSHQDSVSIKSGFDGIDTNELLIGSDKTMSPFDIEKQDDSDSGNKQPNIGSKSSKLKRRFSPTNVFPLPPRRDHFSFEFGRAVFAKPWKSEIWYKAKLLKEIKSKKEGKYLVGFLSGQKLQQKVSLKCIGSCNHIHPDDIELGTRIVAGRPSDTVNSTVQKKYKVISNSTSFTVMFAGTIAELACEANRYRYLVFFDDGYAQYLSLDRMFPVVHSSENTWENVAIDCREFIKEYLQEYPFRPLVVTKVGCVMQTEWNGEWWHSRVVSIDSSLVKILFDIDNRSEWIYRGTTRLEPMYNHFISPQPKPLAKKKKKGTVGKAAITKYESYVDEKITDPQFGVSKYSLKDPKGENQIEEWGLPTRNLELIYSRCSDLDESVANSKLITSTVLEDASKTSITTTSASIATTSASIATTSAKNLPKISEQIPSKPKKLKRTSSSASIASSSASECSSRISLDSSRSKKKHQPESKIKPEPVEFASPVPDEPFSFLENEMSSPKPEVKSSMEKEEITEQDMLGALSALRTSPLSYDLKPNVQPITESEDHVPHLPAVLHHPPPDDYYSPNRSPARKSTPPSTPSTLPRTPQEAVTRLAEHACNEGCITDRRDLLMMHQLGTTNYLAIPMLLGWSRESAKRLSSYNRDIYYRAPCKRRLRNLGDVTNFLLQTNCTNVCIDMFCFHSKISCRNVTMKTKTPKAQIDDLSDGRETCPVVCINDIDEELPPHVAYISSRNKAEDVYINIDPGFLVCCECTDNCQDKSKCQCAQLTVESSNAIDGVVDPSAGYHYRRLKECITTGIYECNQNCSCRNNTCYNRVVQNGIQLRLQVFMTENRGWGLRCTDDIPKGTFICTYAGQVLNEQTANREGMDYGDEYLAEMDHIEVVEKAKDGYESDVPELKDKSFEDSDSESFTESESDNSIINISSDSGSISESSDDEVVVLMEPVPKKMKPDSSDHSQKENQMEKFENEKPEGTIDDDKKRLDISSEKTLLLNLPKENLTSNASESKYSFQVPVEVTASPRSSSTISSTQSSCSSSLSTQGETVESTENIPPCHVPLQRIPSTELPKRLDSMSEDSFLTDITPDDSVGPEMMMEKKLASPLFIPNIDDIENSLETKKHSTIPADPKDSSKETEKLKVAAKKPGENLIRLAKKSTGQLACKSTGTGIIISKANMKPKSTCSVEEKKVEKTRSTRALYRGDNQMYIIDAKSFGNVGRFMNHSCAPNIFVQNVMVDTHDLRFPWVAFFAQQNIPAFTELTWDYNYEIGSVPGKELICKCGARQCKGRLL